jgi:hypothetical protein
MIGIRRGVLAATAVALLVVVYVSAAGPVVTRGPYLQRGGPDSVVVRWRTDVATDSRVCRGSSPASLTTCVDVPQSTTEHVVALAGLAANTTYYYSVGSTAAALAGGDANHFFVTSPASGTSKPTRLWVLGDSGTANANASAVRDAYYNFTGTRHTDLWLMLGDNAYNDGTDTEYQNAVFNIYQTMLRKSVLWPTLGNHDGHTADSASQTGPYYDIFTLPTGAEVGGVPSGTEAYYSFDYGNIHFVCLESYETNRLIGGPMINWLVSDLNATNKEWIIAFWHHPPYSKGSHNSDTETELIQMRENAVKKLEDAGVDLVLTGHSHSYERSFLIDGHYGASGTFVASMKKDGGSGREDGSGAYKKPTLVKGAHEGAVYAVAGSSGQTSGGLLNHPAMYISLNALGSMVLDVDGNRLDAKFLDNTGATRDYFTMLKGAPAAPTSLTATPASTSQINLAWTDNASSEDGYKIERSTDGASFSQIDTVGPSVTSYASIGLSAGTLYYYRVRGYNEVGNSGYSNVASATTLSNPPAAPTGLTATAVSSTQINLAWTDNATNESLFKIERSTDGVNFAQFTTVGANVTSYSDTGRAPSTTYYYRVRANNSGGDSGYSNVASATTQSGPPAAASGLTATGVSASQINLAWTDSSNNETNFRIEQSLNGTSFTEVATVGANSTSYSRTGLAANTRYYFRVRGWNASGFSGYSNTANAKTRRR